MGIVDYWDILGLRHSKHLHFDSKVSRCFSRSSPGDPAPNAPMPRCRCQNVPGPATQHGATTDTKLTATWVALAPELAWPQHWQRLRCQACGSPGVKLFESPSLEGTLGQHIYN